MGKAADILAEQLGYLAHGHALWTPEPLYGNVYVGDVGHIDEDGAFHRLFNVTVGEDHLLNQKGVPDGFTPLQLKEQLVFINPSYLPPQAFCSRSVKSQKIGGQIDA